MAEDSSEHLAIECRRRIFAGRFDEPHATSHGKVVLGCDPLLGAFKHRGRGVNDRDGVALPRQRDALVASPTSYIDQLQGWWGQVSPDAGGSRGFGHGHATTRSGRRRTGQRALPTHPQPVYRSHEHPARPVRGREPSVAVDALSPAPNCSEVAAAVE